MNNTARFSFRIVERLLGEHARLARTVLYNLPTVISDITSITRYFRTIAPPSPFTSALIFIFQWIHVRRLGGPELQGHQFHTDLTPHFRYPQRTARYTYSYLI